MVQTAKFLAGDIQGCIREEMSINERESRMQFLITVNTALGNEEYHQINNVQTNALVLPPSLFLSLSLSVWST